MNAATVKRSPRKKVVTRKKMLSRRQTLVELPKDTRQIVEGSDLETKNFMLDLLRLGDAGILR